MGTHLNRRGFLASAAFGAGALALTGNARRALAQQEEKKAPLYEISLAEWSLHRTIREGKLDNLDFAKFTKQECGIHAIEYVNQFFKDKAKDAKYLAELNTRANGEGVKQLLIMIDGEGRLGAKSDEERTKAVENHFKWVEAAKTLGCHSIRVNAGSTNDFLESMPLAADGLRRVCEFAEPFEINVIVENHGGLSSNAAWLAGVMELTDHPLVGTLPDFGNFRIGDGKEYERYKGVVQLMPYAKAVSAKSHEFNAEGQEVRTDYLRMMGLVTGWGYRGFVGIEYEGSTLPEKDGILATKALLESVRETLSGHH